MKIVFFLLAILGMFTAPAFAQQLTPAKVLDLSAWHLSLPIDMKGTGKATTIYEKEIAEGFVDSKNFYVNEAGNGVVFSSPIKGVLTSNKTTYARSELREMGRRGDTSIRGQFGNRDVLSLAKFMRMTTSLPSFITASFHITNEDRFFSHLNPLEERISSTQLLAPTFQTITPKMEQWWSQQTESNWGRNGDTKLRLSVTS